MSSKNNINLLDSWGIAKHQDNIPISVNNLEKEAVSSGEQELRRMIKLEAEKQKAKKERKKPGRKGSVVAAGRERHIITTSLYGTNYEYCIARAKELGIGYGQITALINFLIDEDRKNHPEIEVNHKKTK